MYGIRVNKKLFRRCWGNRYAIEALAFAIKAHQSGYLFDSYADIAVATGVSEATARRKMRRLLSFGLAKREKGHFRLPSLRAQKFQKRGGEWITPKYGDIIISLPTSKVSIDEIKTAIRAELIADKQRTRDYLAQMSRTATDPDFLTPLSEIKKARAVLRRYGLKSFVDCGLSLRYLRKACGCGQGKLYEMFAYAERREIFWRIVYAPWYEYIGDASRALDSYAGKMHYTSRACAVYQPAASISLVSPEPLPF